MKKIKNILTLLCRSSSVDRDTNLVSILEILEEITITSNIKIENQDSGKGNILAIPFEIFTVWERSSDVNEELTSKIKITVVNPKGVEKEGVNTPLKFELTKKKMRLRVKVPVFEFFGYGTYLFKIYLEQDSKFVQVQETSFDVKAEIKV